MSPPVSGGGGNAACAPQHHTPPFSFPGKKTGGVTVQKKGVCIASEQLEELQRLPMLLPARGVAAFEAAIRFASAPIIRCCAAVGGSAALRMRHTPCGCRSAHLVEVQPNFRLPPVSTMRRAQQCRYFARSLPPCYRHSRLTIVSAVASGHESQGFMAKPCTPHLHCAARAALQAANPQWRGQGAGPLAFSWGFQGGHSLT